MCIWMAPPGSVTLTAPGERAVSFTFLIPRSA
jgi:hypothetical protein